MAWLKMGQITTKHHIWVIGVKLSNTLHYQNFHWGADFQVTLQWLGYHLENCLQTKSKKCLRSCCAPSHTTLTKRSNFVSIHIWFVTNMRQEQTLCITLDLIWRKQQVGGKIAFYFQTKTCCLLKTKSNVCNLKKVFLSRKTCSNAAHQLVDGLLLLCKVMKARYHYVYQHNDRLKINLHSLH